jgi:hypothetical protein
MANTDVRITQQGEEFVPDVFTVPVFSGDTVTFYGDPDSQTNLCMTAATAAILSPQPDLTVTLAADGNIAFTFTAAAPGKYCIITQSADWPYPSNIFFGSDDSAVLSISVGRPAMKFSSPDTVPQT